MRQGSNTTPLAAGTVAGRKGGRAGWLAPLVAALAFAAITAPVTAWADDDAPKPFRLCADPANMPFSSSAAENPGIYVELGQDIAHSLGRPFEAVWSLSYWGKRTVRTTLLAGQCDAYIGLPAGEGFMGPQLIFSKPFLKVGYALVVPPGFQVTRLGDLKGKRVAVQFSTPPQSLVATRDDIGGVTFLNPEDAMQALARHEVAAAFIWGPTAGYMNATVFHDAYRVIPVAGDGMQWPVAIGFAKAKADLRDTVDGLLEKDAGAIHALEAKYGFPDSAPIELARNDRAGVPGVIRVAADAPAEAQTAANAIPPRRGRRASHAGRERRCRRRRRPGNLQWHLRALPRPGRHRVRAAHQPASSPAPLRRQDGRGVSPDSDSRAPRERDAQLDWRILG
jgi:polar amino acid transport system substrate-binding protein